MNKEIKTEIIISIINIILGFVFGLLGALLKSYILLISGIYPFIIGIALATLFYIDKKQKELVKELKK
jgi:purine-cytosine permease-like protein